MPAKGVTGARQRKAKKEHRKRCPECDGFGKVLGRKGTIKINCPKCKGTKVRG